MKGLLHELKNKS